MQYMFLSLPWACVLGVVGDGGRDSFKALHTLSASSQHLFLMSAFISSLYICGIGPPDLLPLQQETVSLGLIVSWAVINALSYGCFQLQEGRQLPPLPTVRAREENQMLFVDSPAAVFLSQLVMLYQLSKRHRPCVSCTVKVIVCTNEKNSPKNVN